jgi:uncharacterized protein (UPF0261 family)
MSTIYVIGTCDTKGAELRYIRDLLRERHDRVVLVDVSTTDRGMAANASADVAPGEVAAHHPNGATAVFASGDRGRAISGMSEGLVGFLSSRHDIGGVIALGGSGGTALVAPAFQALPIGVPKMLVSTVASGNIAPYVGESDITIVYSVTDIAGLNRVSRRILGNAAHALAGMADGAIADERADKPVVGLTMFGVTTPCVQEIVRQLSSTHECLVFHATGTGGRSFEKLVDNGLIRAGLDVTTTEVCDLICGGVFAATEDRLGAFIRTGAPYVGSCGALDMVNFGAFNTVPEHYRHRTLHVHNAQVTLMRTNAEECRRIGCWIADRLSRCAGEVRFLIPEGGVSALSAPGQVFHDSVADAALFEAIESNWRPAPSRRLIRLPHAINSSEFASALVASFNEINASSLRSA